MKAFENKSFTPTDSRLHATLSVPTPVEAESSFSMMILCKSAVATFSIATILDCLASTDQPAKWITGKTVCRDFRKVKNVGISFTCTDREWVTQLGGIKVNICGRTFQILKYSVFSHLYWIDVTLSQDATAEHLWNYFNSMGSRPVLIKPTFCKGSIASHALTVYFSTKEVPACLLLGPEDPVREIYPMGSHQAPCFVNHRIARFNKKPPPSIAAKVSTNQAASKTKASPTQVAIIPTNALSTTPLEDLPTPSANGNSTQDLPLDESIDIVMDSDISAVSEEILAVEALPRNKTKEDTEMESEFSSSSGSENSENPPDFPELIFRPNLLGEDLSAMQTGIEFNSPEQWPWETNTSSPNNSNLSKSTQVKTTTA
ncbi:hypothetical protein H310_13725 [Aphanomyces invadans]|uniref:Uncharacterized protein n=1 Tax=Aphanomyces invadans TaxID=157072 RepID=A0A024TF48_9STRA|nr:hypothetical protein H310_13725 [Aphanomyces invadans]ETV91937.1 hypothetical protein H310_13725 [Aphanomyces invadans]|eukprot:XP_008879574.1 hypothetical protein H310_13725 [Aphanomyces invadans]